MASTMATTWRSLPADAITKASVMTSWSATSMTTTSCAFLSAAAWAAVNASSRPRSVTLTALPSSWTASSLSHTPDKHRNGQACSNVQAALADVLHDAVRDQVPDRLARRDARPAIGGRDRHRGHLDQADRVGGQVGVGEDEARPGHPDEVRQREHLVGVLPGEDPLQGVRAGDEVERRGRPVRDAQVAERVDRVGRPG